MKILNTFFLLYVLFFGTLTTKAQNNSKLSYASRQWLINQPTEKATFVLLLNHELNLDSLNEALYQQKTPLPQRQLLVLKQLRATMELNYAQFESLNQQAISDKSLKLMSKLWIINGLVISAEKADLMRLSEQNIVKYIEKDDAYGAVLHSPVDVKATPTNGIEAINGAEQGLKVIGAPAMWARGYTGRGRVTMNMDTGVWPTHPAIKNRFLSQYAPLVQSWKGIDIYYPQDKSNSHGTHTLGTQLGLDTSRNDTIGVAPGAYFMATDPIVENIAFVKPLSSNITTLQWSLDPDNNPNTVNDIPDAINNSWGYSQVTMPQICDSTSFVVTAFKAMETAGIAIVFSAGNSGPNGTTIGQPQYVNPGLVNTFTVGALDGNNSNLPIANFSSRGPSVCGGTGSLLIKPEVAAPGVNVRSAVGQNGYSQLSGTSMAGPHVTGAVLLLKEAFPNLTGEEIKMALYTTATDLGTIGEDNTFGMGLINVDSAFKYLSTIHTPVDPRANYQEVLIKNINAPEYTCNPSLTSVAVEVANLGDSALINPLFTITLPNGTTLSVPTTGTVAPGQSQWFTLNANIALVPNLNEISIKVYSFQNDYDQINNTRMLRIFQHQNIIGFPWVETFENVDFTWGNWRIENQDGLMTWDTVEISQFQNSNFSANINLTNYLPRAGQLDALVSPYFTIPANGQVRAQFYMSYRTRGQSFRDSLWVLLSKDCGATYTDTLYANGGQAMNTYQTGFEPVDSTQWQKINLNLNKYANNNVLFKILVKNDFGGNLMIDSFSIQKGLALGNTSPSTASLTLYPNPTNALVTVCCNDNVNLQQWQLVDIQGRKIPVQFNNNGTDRITFNVETLPNGVYFLNGTGTKTLLQYKLVVIH